MNILHLLSQTHLTGAEVYAATLIKQQQAEGHRCWIVSDTLTISTTATYMAMSIHNRRLLNRLRNIYRLVHFCRKHRIEVIHAHSRAASWIANLVRWFVPVTYISTVHGRQSVHASSQRANVYGQHIIVVCEHLADHLRQELKIQHAQIHVIRNGIE